VAWLEARSDSTPNECFLGTHTVGTVTFGVTVGRWSRPQDYSNPVNPLGTELPRLHYELFQRIRLSRIATSNMATLREANPARSRGPGPVRARTDRKSPLEADRDLISARVSSGCATFVVMVEVAHFGKRHDLPALGWLERSWVQSVLAESERARVVVGRALHWPQLPALANTELAGGDQRGDQCEPPNWSPIGHQAGACIVRYGDERGVSS
jgi:hypothetical protein